MSASSLQNIRKVLVIWTIFWIALLQRKVTIQTKMAVAIQKIVKFLFNDKPEKQRENTIRSSYEYMEKNIRQSKKASVRENMYRRLRKKLRQLHVLGIHNHVDECSMWKIMVLQMAMTLINNLISRKCWVFFFFSFKRTKNPLLGKMQFSEMKKISW